MYSNPFVWASFQVGSIMTTTGHSSCDYSVWSRLSKMILFLLTVCGASAGSTGGGFKVSRLFNYCEENQIGYSKVTASTKSRSHHNRW